MSFTLILTDGETLDPFGQTIKTGSFRLSSLIDCSSLIKSSTVFIRNGSYRLIGTRLYSTVVLILSENYTPIPVQDLPGSKRSGHLQPISVCAAHLPVCSPVSFGLHPCKTGHSECIFPSPVCLL